MGWDGLPAAVFSTLSQLVNPLKSLILLPSLYPQEIRFPGTAFIPLRCLCGLAASLTAVSSLSLPPLPPAVPPDSPQQRAALRAVAGLSTLVDLCLEGWAVTDAGARTLGQGLPRLQRLVLGNSGALSRVG